MKLQVRDKTHIKYEFLSYNPVYIGLDLTFPLTINRNVVSSRITFPEIQLDLQEILYLSW